MARQGLDPDAVVAAAARIADRDGLGAVTIAAVAADLGVRPPSLYNHVESRQALLVAIGLRGTAALTAALSRAAAGLAGDDALLAVAHAQRAFAREHPGEYDAMHRALGARDERVLAAGEAAVDVIRAVLRGYGLEGEEAIHAARAARSTVHGFVALELASGYAIGTDLEASFEWTIRTLGAGLRVRGGVGA
ncbi:WHG domain-containing protein [Paraconexibacter antarcticus]|uniref:WHG domain-containing protein n=1 Tax=Paraconexibacter antarcticus TaxID=2949664 RepID=A0ABY5DWB5_9ACTN|nr:TetR-like C-terminal domain-containing protein [Paraconexibacter antarcticus]UTI65824.1 WHG domain-containing protein [Paraconexibacter antarcticus]